MERFHEKYFVHPVSGCWLWTASLSRTGYGQISEGPPTYRTLKSHRVAYEHFVGLIPFDLVVDHMCNQPRCVNPEHLQLLTRRQNIMRSNHPLIVAQWLNQCPRGHDLSDPDNVYLRPKGGRMCQVCVRMRSKRYYEAEKAARRNKVA